MPARWIPIAAAAPTLAAGAAFPATAGSSAPAGKCVRTTRGNVYRTIANDRCRCEGDGNRPMLIDLAGKATAPEGSCANLPGAKTCGVGKGGFILSCSLR